MGWSEAVIGEEDVSGTEAVSGKAVIGRDGAERAGTEVEVAELGTDSEHGAEVVIAPLLLIS